MPDGPQGLFLTRTPRNLRVSRGATAARLGFVSGVITLSAVLLVHVYACTRPHRMLAGKGQTVQARVVSLAYSNNPPPARWTINYRFEAADGFSYAGHDVVPVARLAEVDQLKPIEVTYYPPNPSVALVGRVDSARVTEELLSRWPTAAVAALLLAAGVSVAMWHRRRTWLIRYGSLTPGTITGKEESGEGESLRRVVRFTFVPDGGAEVSGTADLGEEAFARIKEGARELVFYNPRSPSQHILYAASPFEIEEI